MRPLAFASNAFKQDTLEGAIDAIADAGYAGLEVMADIPHAYPLPMPASRLDALKAQLQKRNLVVSNVNAFTLFADGDTYHPTWIEDDEQRRQRRIEHTIASIELSAQLSSPTVSLQPGGPLIGMSVSAKGAAERFAAGLHHVLPIAKQHNIILAVEPEPGLLIQTSQEYLDFKNTFFKDEPLVKMNCDIGHLFCVGEDPADVVKAMPEQIAHIHIEDIAENRVHQHLRPGNGAIDFPRFFAALDEIDYQGWVTVELYPYEATAGETARLAMEHLTQLD